MLLCIGPRLFLYSGGFLRAGQQCRGDGVQVQYARVHDGAAVQGVAQCAVHAVFEVEFAAPFDDVREEVTVVGGVFGEEGLEVEGFLGGDEGVEAYLLRRDSSPVGVGHAVLGVGAAVAYFLKIMVVLSAGLGRFGGAWNRGVSEEIVPRGIKNPRS